MENENLKMENIITKIGQVYLNQYLLNQNKTSDYHSIGHWW